MFTKQAIAKFTTTFFLNILFLIQVCSQDNRIAKVAMKNNLLYDMTTTLNLGVEFKVASKYSLDIGMNYNPWEFSQNKKIKHILIQPEIRYWNMQPFSGHFFGFHMLYAHYNAGGVSLPFGLSPAFKENRYQGDFYGAGFSYGYQWQLSSRWNMEATLGIGFIHNQFDRYRCVECGEFIESRHNNYFGPTKAGISIIYIIE